MGYLSRVAGIAVAALALLTSASAGVNAPQSGWYSGNPSLGPSALRDLACSGSTCYAAGDFGTLLKSTDGGGTWKGIVTGLTVDLRRVSLAGGSSDKVVIAAQCALRRSDDGGEHFVRLPFSARDNGCPNALIGFSFPTDQTGYVLLAGGRLLATADGGRSWSRRTNVPQVSSDLTCTSATTCFAAGIGGIVRTSDGGVSWTVATTTNFGMRRFAQADPLTLYVGGDFGFLSKSTDGGQSWKTFRLDGSGSGNLIDIECGDSLHCLMATNNGSLDGPVVRTDDGGASGSTVTPSTDPTYAVGFAGPLRSLAVGAVGSAEVSDDAGATWAAVGTRIIASFSTLTATATKVAYAGGAQGALVRTGDAGQSWASVSPPTDSAVISLAGAGPDRLYVLAGDGSLQRSDNGGQSYSLLNPGTFRAVAIAAVDADRLLLLGQRGLALSTNAGESFDRARGAVAQARLRAADLALGAVFVYGDRGIFVSTDAGAHWRRVPKPKPRVFDLDFVDRNRGFLLASGGTLWRTVDGGRHWTLLPALGGPALAIEFSPRIEGFGFAAVQGRGSLRGRGVVLRTTNEGRSWHPQLVSPTPVADLENAGSVDYLLSGASSLYATAIGGDVGAPSSMTITARPRSLRRPGFVTVAGRLSPADGGEEVVVSRFSGGRWAHKLATAAANGTFVTRWRVVKEASFAAQAVGDADHTGAGTRALSVRVR